jgi:hypothetical protein
VPSRPSHLTRGLRPLRRLGPGQLHDWFLRALLIGAIGLTPLGCAADPITVTGPSHRPPETPAVGDLPALDDALLVEAVSGHFTLLSERHFFVRARLTVWDSGLVTANVAALFEQPRYRAIQLTVDELSGLRQRLLDGRLTTYFAQDVTGQPLSCADCNVEIIRTDVSGPVVEIAIGSAAVRGSSYPSNVKALSQEILDLLARFHSGGGEPWKGSPPLIQVTPPQAGG